MQAVNRAIDETDKSYLKFMIQLTDWAKEIEREIGSFYGYPVKAKTFNVTGCTIDLPDDCYNVLTVLPGDYEDQCNAQYLDIGSVQLNEDVRDDEITLLWMPLDANIIYPKRWTVQADQLNLIDKYTAQDLTLIYQYIEIDDQGNWEINQTHEKAIVGYLKYKLAGKENWKVFKSDKMMRQGHFEMKRELERDYNIEIRNARALDAVTNPYEQDNYIR